MNPPHSTYEYVRNSDDGQEAFELAVRSAFRGLRERSPGLEWTCLAWLESWTQGVRDGKSKGPL